MWVGLTQSFEAQMEIKKLNFQKRPGLLWQMAFALKLHHGLPWVPSLSAHATAAGRTAPHNCRSQLLTRNPFLYKYT